MVFRSNRTPRKPFRRFVTKKNGNVRRMFRPWVERMADSQGPGQAKVADDKVKHPDLLILERMRPLEEKVAKRKHGKTPEKLLARDALHEVLGQVFRNWLVVSVGHDDYTRIPGGVQVCIQREQYLTNAAGGHYLNIHPWQPLPRMAHECEDPDPVVVLVLDGVQVGTCRMSVLTEVLRTRAETGLRMLVTLHHLLGHSPERITDMCRIAHPEDVFLWLHDFFTLCPGVRLQRNDLQFCGAPDLASNACGLCVYGPERVAHLDRMKGLFAELAPKVIAPSQVTLDFWESVAAFRVAGTRVVPHVTLEWVPRADPDPVSDRPADHTRIRVGFLGTAARHKGWPIFQRLSYMPELADRFDFVALTASKAELRGKAISVNVTPEHPNAMADAVREQKIDLVLHWPDWPETFALTALEAMEGGAFVVTNSGSGNVAASVRNYDRGVVLTDERALLDFFEGDAVEALARRARETWAAFSVQIVPSRLSLAAFEETL
jgi:hypothetical protein